MSATSATSSSSAVQLSGLASGIDWTSIVNELVSIEQAPETQMNAQITTDTAKKTAYTQIGTDLTALGKDVTTLSNPGFFDDRTASAADSSVASATAAAATPLGTYTFNFTQLATDAVQQGATATSAPLSSSDDVSSLVLSSAGFSQPVTAGTFTVNGQQVTIATSDTLQSVFNKISTATNGAVTASYNSTTDEISLTSSSGNIVLGSSTDTSNFLTDAQLYNNGTNTVTSTSALGGINLSNPLTSANFATTVSDGGSGSGSFLINGVSISFNASKDSVNDILQRINNSAAGVTATYDGVNKRFELTNKTTGDVGISMQDVTGNFLAATGLSTGTLARGTNLQYTVNNGGTLTSESNTIDGSASGITGLSVTALSKNSTTITVASDTSTISSAISSFVTDYNAVQNYIATQTTPSKSSSGTVTPGTLTGDNTSEGIATELRQLTDASPLSGVISSLNDLGIVSNGNDNTLSLSSTTTLNSALTTNLDAVKNLFTNSTTGIATTLNTYLTNINGTNGILATDETSMTNEIASINQSITTLNARISLDQTRLTNEFVAMETAISAINSQKQYLNSFLNGGTAASGSTNSAAPTASSITVGGSNNNSSSTSGTSSTSS